MYLRVSSIPLLAFCLLGAIGNAASNPTSIPISNPDGVRARLVDVEHIALDLQFDWLKRQAYGRAELRLRAFAELESFTLDAAHFAISKVALVNGQELAFAYDGSANDDALKVLMNRPIAADEVFTVSVHYRTLHHNDSDPNSLSGSNGCGLRFIQGPSFSEPRKRQQLFSANLPGCNRYWFPGFDGPGNLRTFELKAQIQKPLMLISNGALLERKDLPNGNTYFHYQLDQPHANDRNQIVVGEYALVKQEALNTELRSFSYPDEVEATTASVAQLPEMLSYFTDLTGHAYPYASYTQAFVQDLPSGLHGVSMAINTENMVDDYPTHYEYKYLWDTLQSDMLARQWFANLLSVRNWQNTWLSQGLSHYADLMYAEHRFGTDEILLWTFGGGDQATYFADWNAGLREALVPKTLANHAGFLTGNTAYAKGAWVAHMLRKQLGDRLWRQCLKKYVRNNAGSLVDTDDLQQACEAVSGQDLGWFFAQWVYGVGHPDFEVIDSYDPNKKQLTLVVKQRQTIDAKLEIPQSVFFKGYVEIETDQGIEKHWLDAKVEQTLRLSLARAPSFVNFDYQSTWIKTLKQDRSTAQWLAQLKLSQDALAKRAAMVELVRIGNDSKISAALRKQIQQALLDKGLSTDYWRVRTVALQQLNLLLSKNTTTNIALAPEALKRLLQYLEKTAATGADQKLEEAWPRNAVLNLLGNTRDAKLAEIYIRHLNDASDRVINAAAIALGKSNSPLAFDALASLPKRASWKNQSLISALYGLKELNDPRAIAIALAAIRDVPAAPRWTLATPVWDYRFSAAETLAKLGAGGQALTIVRKRLEKSIAAADINDVFQNIMMLVTLADADALPLFAQVRKHYQGQATAIQALDAFESQLKSAFKKE
jgi:aminopeptidase N